MYFVIDCTDYPNSFAKRAANRDQHLAYLELVKPAILSAGPKLDDHGRPIGSVLIIDFANIEAARNFASDDPYAQVGLFADVVISAYRQVLPTLSERRDSGVWA